MNGLMIHTPGSHYVSLDALRTIPTPQSMGPRHQPIPHSLLVDTVLDQISNRGWSVKKMKLGVSAKGQKLFGTMDLNGVTHDKPVAETGITFGFRSSTNESLAIRGVAGVRVFVCDNLCMSGETFVMRRKSTTLLNLPLLINKGLNKFLDQSRLLEQGIEHLKTKYLSDDEAKQNIFNLFNEGTMPLHLFDDVAKYYFNPQDDQPDCMPRTKWGLSNACTRSIQKLKPAAQFDCSLNVGRYFRLANDLDNQQGDV